MNIAAKIFWLYGRSGAGKTTLARRLHGEFLERKIPVFYLDGDDLRSGVCADLTFTPEARLENHRRIAEVAKLAASQNLNVIVSSMAPQYVHRDVVRKILEEKLIWIHIDAPLEVCIQRDPKGLYRRAQAGQLDKLINYPFDAPRVEEREYYIDTVAQNVEVASRKILKLVQTVSNLDFSKA